MRLLGKIALGAAVTIMLIGCGEGSKYGDKEYTFEYLRDNEQLLVELVQWCELNKNANLNTTQMKNCQTAYDRKSRLTQKWGNEPSKWEKLVEKYGTKKQ